MEKSGREIKEAGCSAGRQTEDTGFVDKQFKKSAVIPKKSVNILVLNYVQIFDEIHDRAIPIEYERNGSFLDAVVCGCVDLEHRR